MENVQVPNESNDNCPVAPEPRVTVYTRVLHRACQIVGGVESLATQLRVPTPTLYRWLDGESDPPTQIFLRAVDIVLPAWSGDDELLAKAIRATRPKNGRG